MKKYILTTIMIIFIGFFAYSQKKPTTVKCKNKNIERVRKHCVCKDIEQYAKNNYNVRSVSSYAQSGFNRIYTRFNISNDGQIKNIQVKGGSPELEKEAIRTLMSFPDIIPANPQSKTILNSQEFYTILIQFEVKNTITNL
ncbi:TonB protein C-terminal [Aquimarina amphilecti]|uniref:TonB protein C-terminal n=1 Tax=Aquimarina amphilecti TaxID=1038014 RepID=A0A1H7RLH5_AQUAM|nr:MULTISPECIES: hypothetical protein [Aquimarina]AXT57951.1 hypothetical protein D1815_20150 [Aquimarina sp. AD1]RKN04273.1 hypothetical protein D7035_21890 [Aquimarina sp. AD1]SEL61096.1 TonB protein C-terminal [Aquimarina amphilecti]